MRKQEGRPKNWLWELYPYHNLSQGEDEALRYRKRKHPEQSISLILSLKG